MLRENIYLMAVLSFGILACGQLTPMNQNNRNTAALQAAASENESAATRMVKFSLTSSPNLRLEDAPSMSLFANEVDLLCPDAKPVKIQLSATSQQITVYKKLAGCTFQLQSFIDPSRIGLPTAEALFEYQPSADGVATANGEVLSEFDVTNAEGAVVDRQLVSSQVAIRSDGCPDLTPNCDMNEVTIMFSVSDLERSDVTIDNTLHVQDVALELTTEPAPECALDAAFVSESPTDPLAAPELQLTLSSCSNLFSSDDLQYAVMDHRYDNVYHINRDSTDPANVVGLSQAIDGFGADVVVSDRATIKLTMAQIEKITHKTSEFAALRENLVLAIRNAGGKSIRYYVISNQCNNTLVQMMTDKVNSMTSTQWQLHFPGTATNSYWTVNQLVSNLGSSSSPLPDFCEDTTRYAYSDATYSGILVSSYDLDKIYRLGLSRQPANWPMINYIINRYYNAAGYTAGELQKAIWSLIDDRTEDPGIGAVNPTHVAEIVIDARANGACFAPVCSNQYMAVLLVPKNGGQIAAQITFVAVRPSDLGVTWCAE